MEVPESIYSLPKRIFPEMTEFRVKPLGRGDKSHFFEDATDVSVRTVSHNLFVALSLIPKATKVNIERLENSPVAFDQSGILPTFKTTHLHIEKMSTIHYQDFKLFFTALPNLESLILREIKDNNCVAEFDEDDFVNVLSENKSTLAKLKKIQIPLKKCSNGLTGKSVVAIIKNSSNLVELNSFKDVAFSATDESDLLHLSAVGERNLRVEHCHNLTDDHKWFTCTNGQHRPV
jgi:hypothetical protein